MIHLNGGKGWLSVEIDINHDRKSAGRLELRTLYFAIVDGWGKPWIMSSLRVAFHGFDNQQFLSLLFKSAADGGKMPNWPFAEMVQSSKGAVTWC